MKNICLIALIVAALCMTSQAQDCPNGLCPQTVSFVVRTPVRNFAAQFAPTNWAPVRASGSNGAGSSGVRSSVIYTTVAAPVYAVQTYATVRTERTYKVRDWRPLATRRAGGSRGR